MANAPSPKQAKPAAKSPAARKKAAGVAVTAYKPPPKRRWDVGHFLTARDLLTADQFAAAIDKSAWDHYVYGLCLDNGAVFYVGKGIRDRALDHEKQARQGEQSEKSDYIRYIGPRLRYTLFLQCQDDAYAKGYEAYLIQGHHDVLTNIVIPSVDVFHRMFQPIDQFEQSLQVLRQIGEYVEKADQECRFAMAKVIAGHPPIINTLTDDDLAWFAGSQDGAAVRAQIKNYMAEVQYGGQ